MNRLRRAIEPLSRLGAGAVVLLLCACLGGRPPEPARYFRPEPPAEPVSALDGPPPAGTPRATLRLHRVTAAAHLDSRMVWRSSDVEFGFYESRRWAEHPAHYVEQLISRELFEERGLRRATAGVVPTLEVELLAFEEVLMPAHEARVVVHVLLLDQRRLARLERTFIAEQPIADGDPVSVSRAIGRALNQLVMSVADEVQAALAGSET